MSFLGHHLCAPSGTPHRLLAGADASDTTACVREIVQTSAGIAHERALAETAAKRLAAMLRAALPTDLKVPELFEAPVTLPPRRERPTLHRNIFYVRSFTFWEEYKS